MMKKFFFTSIFTIALLSLTGCNHRPEIDKKYPVWYTSVSYSKFSTEAVPLDDGKYIIDSPPEDFIKKLGEPDNEFTKDQIVKHLISNGFNKYTANIAANDMLTRGYGRICSRAGDEVHIIIVGKPL
ncbi:hypothetical protein [Treponema pedis]|uniref:hypothetical protein n=1 Tax=Treponema pedis TaxID=409322 RepID=UPI000401B37C|nr:hypothetical protein [Treponema pedis]